MTFLRRIQIRSATDLADVFPRELRFLKIKFLAVLVVGSALLTGLAWGMARLAGEFRSAKVEQQRIFANFEALAKLSADKEEAGTLAALAEAGIPTSFDLIDKFPRVLQGLAAAAEVRASLDFGRELPGAGEEPKYIEIFIRADGGITNIARFIELLENEQLALRATDFRVVESETLRVFQLQLNGKIYVR